MDSQYHDNFPFRELAALKQDNGRTWMDRKHFVRADDVAAIEGFREAHRNIDVYTSVGRFAEPQLDARAVVPLFFDIDAEGDLEAARTSTLQAGELLQQRLMIPPDMIELFFSGHKGFHLCLSSAIFGDVINDRLVTIWRALAQRLAREGVQYIDHGVYQNARLLRLVNSKHSASGLYKVPLEWAELQDLGLGHVLDLARQPREHESMASPPAEVPQAMGWLQDALTWRRQHRHAQRENRRKLDDARGWRIPPCIRRIEEGIALQDGQRHAMYFHIARIYAGVGAHPVEIAERLKAIDQRNPIKDGSGYIERLAHDAGKYAGYFKSCPHELFERFCDATRCPFNQSPGNEAVKSTADHRSTGAMNR